MVAGKLVKSNGQLVGADLHKLKEQAQQPLPYVLRSIRQKQ